MNEHVLLSIKVSAEKNEHFHWLRFYLYGADGALLRRFHELESPYHFASLGAILVAESKKEAKGVDYEAICGENDSSGTVSRT